MTNNFIIAGSSFIVTCFLTLLISVSVAVTTVKDTDYVRRTLFNDVDTNSIARNLFNLTRLPHPAGSKQDEVVLVDFIKTHFEN